MGKNFASRVQIKCKGIPNDTLKLANQDDNATGDDDDADFANNMRAAYLSPVSDLQNYSDAW